MKFVIPMALVFSFVAIAFVPSENLYAQFFPIDRMPHPRVSTTIAAERNEKSAVQGNTANGNNNILQNCAQTETGKENSQSIDCQQNQKPNNALICPVGNFRNSFGYCVTLLQLS